MHRSYIRRRSLYFSACSHIQRTNFLACCSVLHPILCAMQQNDILNMLIFIHCPKTLNPPFCMTKWLRAIQGKRKVQGVPQSQTVALSRHQEEEETDKSKQAQIKQTYEKH